MNSVQIHNAFNIEAGSYKDKKIFDTLAVDYYINKAQDNIFQKYYERFEKAEDKRFALDELITVSELSSSTDLSSNQEGIKENGVIWAMPEYFHYSVEESAIDDDSNIIPVKPITRDFYNSNIKNPFTKPNHEIIWRLDHKPSTDDTPFSDGTYPKRRELITDGRDIVTYVVTYIKRPTELNIASNVVCDLGYKATGELVIEAVRLAYSSDKDTVGYNLKTSEVKSSMNN